jgi:phage baseplate assembly protein W
MTKKISTQEAIARVLTTPLGSRVMRPKFGSELYKLIDKPLSEEFKIDAMHYVYEAIENNLNIDITKVEATKEKITVFYKENGKEEFVDVKFK